MIERKKATVRLTSRIDGDENTNLYPGEYAFRDGTHLITYTDYAGNGITRNGIQANDSAMLLHRVGEFEGDMLFDPGMCWGFLPGMCTLNMKTSPPGA